MSVSPYTVGGRILEEGQSLSVLITYLISVSDGGDSAHEGEQRIQKRMYNSSLIHSLRFINKQKEIFYM